MWRGDLSPLGCAAAPNQTTRCASKIEVVAFGAAAQPSGDKSPRHTGIAVQLSHIAACLKVL
ncbi:hypothetical protein C1C98_25050 [Pseudomonas ogarae]|uniref:Uncharacterized protein n=1 Tax=Pseudomonas ogarae (strain DSM 112162 / CECT 30235 / F113) TaxID=1114970 RepID=A0ABN5GFB4_PSEO1|nr:hypothetical protein C1C98_25050 [Pseudomonas ogarae]